jgi:hypothetical protein
VKTGAVVVAATSPPPSSEPRVLASDPSVLDSFLKEARRRHVGDQTLTRCSRNNIRKDMA